jgi:hypothetical protein
MAVLTNPKVPKTEQMQIALANDCAGLEAKIAKLEKDLDPPEEEEDTEVILYQIHTLLPQILHEWEDLAFEQRMRFVRGLVRRVVLSHPAPSWLKMEIEWRLPEWGTDMKYIKRTTSNGRPWSEEDEQKLREMYPQAPAMVLLDTFPERTWIGIRRRAETLGIERCVVGDITTRSMFAHYSVRDLDFLKEEERKQNWGVKGMDRIFPIMSHSDKCSAWIGSL